MARTIPLPDDETPRVLRGASALGRLLGEGRGALELPRLLLRLPELSRLPGGAGRPVRVLPGFATGDGSTALLRGFLRALDYRVRGWGLGWNHGDVPSLVPRVTAAVVRAAEEAGQPVSLVGWSLGGVLAREAARDAPDAVARVITLGTPVVGGPKYTAVGALFARRGIDLDAVEAEVERRNRVPLRVPVTAIYSRGDGVVAWQACIDRVSPDVEHVEVSTTHLGLGFSADVYRVVAERLARGVSGRRSPGRVSPR